MARLCSIATGPYAGPVEGGRARGAHRLELSTPMPPSRTVPRYAVPFSLPKTAFALSATRGSGERQEFERYLGRDEEEDAAGSSAADPQLVSGEREDLHWDRRGNEQPAQSDHEKRVRISDLCAIC